MDLSAPWTTWYIHNHLIYKIDDFAMNFTKNPSNFKKTSECTCIKQKKMIFYNIMLSKQEGRLIFQNIRGVRKCDEGFK